MSGNEGDNSEEHRVPSYEGTPPQISPFTIPPPTRDVTGVVIPEDVDIGDLEALAKKVAFNNLPHGAPDRDSGDTAIDMSSSAPGLLNEGEITTENEGSRQEDDQMQGTPSKRAWTVKSLLSTIRDKVQEPSGASAPVGKFYYDSVNVFQGLHDLSDSESEGEDEDELSPRSDSLGPVSSDDALVALDSSMTGDYRSSHMDNSGKAPRHGRRNRQQTHGPSLAKSMGEFGHRDRSTADSSSPLSSSPPSPSNFDRNASSSSHTGSQNRSKKQNPAFEAVRSISRGLSDSALEGPTSRRRNRHRENDGEEWDSQVALELDSGENQSFLGSGAENGPELSRQERQARRAAKNKWYHRLWRQVRRQQTWVFLLVLGICAAMLGLAMEETMHLMIVGRNKLANTTSSYFINYMLWVLFAMASCLVAAFLVHFVAPYSAGSGIPAVKSILSGVLMEHYLSFRTLITKVLGLICVYAAGLFVGKEGPYVHISTALASQLARLPFFAKIRRNEGLKLQLFAAGCAAGVAVTFGAPIGGVIFSIEVTTTYYLIQNLSKGFFCAIVATLFVKLFDSHGLIRFFSTDFQPAPYTSYELLAFSLIGISFGLLGVLFNKFVKMLAQLRRNYKILNSSRYGQVLFIAMFSALVTFPIYPLRLGPTSVLNDLFSTSPLKNWQEPNVYFVLSAVVVLEFVMCGLSVGLPVPCGLYTPMFILGAALGRLVGEVLGVMHILPGLVPAGYAVVGAAAFAAGTTRTLSSSIICFELTRQLEHLLPVLLAVLIASAVGNFFGPSIYDELLKMKGLPYMPPFKSSQGGNRTAKSIMRTEVLFLTTESTYEDVQNLLINSHYASFPLVQSRKSRTLLGIIPRRVLERILDKLESRLAALAERQIEILNLALQDSDPFPDGSAQQASNQVQAGANEEISSTSNNLPSTADVSIDPLLIPQKAEGTGLSDSGGDSIGAEERVSVEINENQIAPKSVLVEPNFKSRFGGLAASLHLDTGDSTLPESQRIQGVMQELTQMAMNEKVGFSRSTAGLDAGPFQLPVQTPHSKVHFLFAMLGLSAAYIVDQGELVGVVTKRDLISLQ